MPLLIRAFKCLSWVRDVNREEFLDFVSKVHDENSVSAKSTVNELDGELKRFYAKTNGTKFLQKAEICS